MSEVCSAVSMVEPIRRFMSAKGRLRRDREHGCRNEAEVDRRRSAVLDRECDGLRTGEPHWASIHFGCHTVREHPVSPHLVLRNDRCNSYRYASSGFLWAVSLLG